jgi:hypothetical protein
MRARWRCSRAATGRAAFFFHKAATRCRLRSLPALGLGCAESYPGVFGAFGGFADDAVSKTDTETLSDRPGIGFEGQGALYRIMRELADL